MIRSPDKNARFWLPELDILRFFAFFWVFSFHGPPSHREYFIDLGFSVGTASVLSAFMQGWGVDVFFCLSAYLITDLLRREYVQQGRINIRAFLIRRALRIWPLYFFLIIFVYFIVPLFVDVGRFDGASLFALTTFWFNWWLAMGYQTHSYMVSNLIIPLWSISVEEQFYIAWPFIFAWTHARKARFAIVCITLLLVAWITRIALTVNRVDSVDAWWFNNFVRVDSIVYGAVAAMLLSGRLPTWRIGTRMLIGLASVGAFWCSSYFGDRIYTNGWWSYPLAGLGSLAALLAVLGANLPKNLLTQTLGFLGKISYGLYAWHGFGYYLVSLFATGVTPTIDWLLSFVVTLVLALATWFALESPMLRLKQRFTVTAIPEKFAAPAPASMRRTWLPHLVGLLAFTTALGFSFVKSRYTPIGLAYSDQFELIGYRIQTPDIEAPYKKVEVNVLVRVLQDVRKDYLIQVDAFDIDGVSLEQVPQPSSTDASKWLKGDVRPLTGYFIYEPKKLAPYIGRVMVSLLDPATRAPLSVTCHNPQPCDAKFGDLRFKMDLRTTQPWQTAPTKYRINGALDMLSLSIPNTVAAGQTINIDTVWRAVHETPYPWSSFVHVMNDKGEMVAQSQSPKLTTRYPTTAWSTNEIIMGQVQVALPDTLPAGTYTLRYGMYALDTLTRQPIATMGQSAPAVNDLIELGAVQVTR